MLIKELLCKKNLVMGLSVAFSLLLLSLSLLFPSTSAFAAEYNAYFGSSMLHGSSFPPSFGGLDVIWQSSDVGGPILDVSVESSARVVNYVGNLPFELTTEKTCSGNTLFPVYVIFGDHLIETINDNSNFSGFGDNYYNTSYYHNSTRRYHFVEEDSETGEGFAYMVIRASRNEPTSSNNNFSGSYSSDLAFSYLPYSSSSVIDNYLEVLAVETFCSETDADNYVNNYVFQDSRPSEPDSPIIDSEFPYSYESGDSENNQEVYESLTNLDSSAFEPQIGSAQNILSWFVQFVGQLADLPEDPHDYRCNVFFYPNSTNIIKFDWNGSSSDGPIPFSTCENEFVYAINSGSGIGSDSGLSSIQYEGAGNFWFISLKGILWIGCFLLIFKMLQGFYYYVYDIINYAFSLEGTEGVV